MPMTAQERRAAIVEVLSRSHQPVSAGALARRFGVSRQLIVGDVALLRAGGEAVTATARGYTLQPRPQGLVRRVACRHEAADMERELEIMVDNGCTVLDVMVDHPVYGQLTGALRLSSRYDVRQFIQRAGAAQPLSLLTEGVHLHTLVCPDEDAFRRVLEELNEQDFLLDEDG
ncbi:MAG: transcription repressor NadR [Oscillospiraceae bacterium]|nr:transcription repressor NadR [Oscillospiraceae bacterium]MCI8716398.1 transcription repressor NadR [Oscillospiraceae bacterium]MCI9316929.1 transcription repressor NadR [Oscillospiraceae bacterium]